MWEGKNLGPFLVQKEIGAGAMGTVYRALYTKTNKRVAIKVVSLDLQKNPKALARFERETIILKKLDHPNIVKLYATGHVKNRPFYAMEYVDGETLDEILRRRGRHTWEEVIRMGQQICAALQHAHGQAIVHRDLKPANIMMTTNGTIKLTDFGIAKGFELEQLTATNAAIGTAAYMSPEQCKGEKSISHKSDLYSLGVMFYELLVGKRPFTADNTLDMYLCHVEGKFERPSRLVLDIPIWLDTLVCQLLEKDPKKRPFDAATVAQALAGIQEKVEARRSAGVDVVTGRASERPRSDATLDDQDTAAARTLRDAVTKRKRKRKPIISATVFHAVGYLTILVALGGLIYWLTRPPAPETLYAQAKRLMETKDAEQQTKARDGPIQKYLSLYPERADTQAAEMQSWADEVDERVKERQLSNRMKHDLAPTSEAADKAMAAIRHEDNGELDAARDDWKELEHHRATKDPELRPLGVVAARHLQRLGEVENRRIELFIQVNAARAKEQLFKGTTDPEKNAALAAHYERFGDLNTALKRWRKIRDQYAGNSEQRVWFLLAAQRAKELNEKVRKATPDVRVQTVLKEAQKLKATNPQESRNLCAEIVALYDGESEDSTIIKCVNEAKELNAQPAATAP